MRVALIIYILFVIGGGTVAGIKAFRYWRSDVDNAKKLAAVLIVRTMLDVLSIGIILTLWYREIVDEFWLAMVCFSVIGVYSLALLLVEQKLANGKISLFSPQPPSVTEADNSHSQ
jgi:hypothetical protein